MQKRVLSETIVGPAVSRHLFANLAASLPLTASGCSFTFGDFSSHFLWLRTCWYLSFLRLQLYNSVEYAYEENVNPLSIMPAFVHIGAKIDRPLKSGQAWLVSFELMTPHLLAVCAGRRYSGLMPDKLLLVLLLFLGRAAMSMDDRAERRRPSST